ncbi:MAG: VWA domain-containing protein [Mailhella sp.]|nr:VWA domain-containing protein [Mailhella sp.]
MKHIPAILCSLALLFGASEYASAREPLLVPGKTTLYQRVISHPGTVSYKSPNAEITGVVDSFTPLYVYDKKVVNGEEWLEVSPSSGASSTQWIRSLNGSRWDKALSLTFTERMGRDPVMFFRSYDGLNQLITSENLGADLTRLVREYRHDTLDASSPLIALEPKASAVPREQFYLMPIFDHSLEYEQYGLKMLKVGCINPGSGEVAPKTVAVPEPRKFKSGVAFVIDTTISMKPYIEKTKEFIHNTYNALEKSPLAEDLSLGVVAYRNSTRHNQNIEYVSRIVSPLTPVSGRQIMEQGLNHLDEAKVSTHAFNEDAFAGIMSAIEQLDWNPYAIKLAVLITDAGAIRNDDKYSSTGLNEEEMRDLLAQKGIRLLVVHLQTEAGKRHGLAKTEKQYRTLTSVKDANLKSVYLPLPAHNAQTASQQFGKLSKAMVNILLKIMKQNAEGQMTQKPEAVAAATPEEKMAQIAQCIGYAAQLEFVGSEKNTQAPRMLEAWAVDKDLVSLSEGKPTEALSVTVLLNKRQLDSLAYQLQTVVDAAKSARDIDSSQLFQRIVSLSAQTVRDPNKLQEGGSAANIAELGVLPEFLEGLPYVSWIMGMTAEGWSAMSSMEQDAKIRELESKIQLYKEYHNDTANWKSFGSPDPADAMYRVPLTSLP